MAKLTYFNIIMLGSLLTAYNMQASEPQETEQVLPGLLATATLNRFAKDAERVGYLEGVQDTLAIQPTFGESLANLKRLAGQSISSAAATAQAKLAPYWAQAEPYTQYVTGPTSALASSLAQAATTTGGTLTGGIESLASKEGVKKWLSLASTQEFLKAKLPADVWNTLANVDRQTYDMITGAVALAVGTYLAGKGLAYGYNYFKGEPVEMQVAKLEQEQAKLIQEANQLQTKAVNMPEAPVQAFHEKQKTIRLAEEKYTKAMDIGTTINQLLTAQAKAKEAAAQPGFIGKAYAKLPGVPSLFTRAPSLDQQIADLTAKHDILLTQARNTSDVAQAIIFADQANAINEQIQQLVAQQRAPQPGFFSRMRANLPTLGMPSFLRRAQAPTEQPQAPVQGPQFATKPYDANLSGLKQLEQSQAELVRLMQEGKLSLEEQGRIANAMNDLNDQIIRLKAKIAQQNTGWRSYLPSRPSLSGIRSWFSRQPQEPQQELEIQKTGEPIFFN